MIIMTNLPICKVLIKPDIVGRMIRWAIELSEFDIQYEPRGPTKGQVYADFVESSVIKSFEESKS